MCIRDSGSFTCTLFMPFENDKYAFKQLDSDDKIEDFVKEVFPDFYELIPNLIENWHQNPLSSMSINRCFPWTVGKFALMGDSAHSTVPFYGQGMNAGFEDCFVINDKVDIFHGIYSGGKIFWWKCSWWEVV